MKALVIDCAVSRLCVAAKNEDKLCCAYYDLGMRQSELLIDSIDYVLSKVDLQTSELDYSALTIGPGSFTGLRLGISALKAIQLAYNVPVYGISTLDMYAQSAKSLGFPILSSIDAHKDRFYAKLFDIDGKIILNEGDYEISEICAALNNFDTIFMTGPDSIQLKELLKKENCNAQLLCRNFQEQATEALFYIAENEITVGNPPLKDFDGPVYLRASEAEIKLNTE